MTTAIQRRYRETNRETVRRLGYLLRTYQTGHPQWYAELLVAALYDGVIGPNNLRDFDVVTPAYGHVQVKTRVQGTDTTQNRINFGRYASEAFDHAAIVVFERDYRIRDAVFLPCHAVLSLVRPSGHVKWQDAAAHPDTVNIRAELVEISGEEQGWAPPEEIERTTPSNEALLAKARMSTPPQSWFDEAVDPFVAEDKG